MIVRIMPDSATVYSGNEGCACLPELTVQLLCYPSTIRKNVELSEPMRYYSDNSRKVVVACSYSGNEG